MTEFKRQTEEFSDGRIITFRSGWESNYASYLDWLKEQGQIRDWEYEPTPRYEFIVTEFGRQRALSLGYLPDFKVTNNDGSFYLVEIKGRRQGMRKLKRMKRFYPKIKIELIEQKDYNILKRKVGKMLNWG
jgi:Protein of unknown function (DUF1064)